MKINKSTFCAGPWFHVKNRNNGDLKPCCELHPEYSEFNGKTNYSYPSNSIEDWISSDYAQYLRKNLNEGVKLPECNHCWRKEDTNHKSLRQSLNDTVTKNKKIEESWIPFYFKNKQDYKQDLILTAEVKLTHVCNFACIMCDPEDSSKIYNSWKNSTEEFFVKDIIAKEPAYFDNITKRYKDSTNYQLLNEVLGYKVKYITFLGGEPLLDQKMMRILENYNLDQANKTTLHFITNGSVNLIETSKRLAHFREVLYSVSLEGTGKVQDYVRRGSNWEEIKNNLESYIQVYGARSVNINYCLQNLTMLHFVDLLNWAHINNIRIVIAFVKYPEYLSLHTLPNIIKQEIIDKLEQSDKIITFQEDDEIFKSVTCSGLVDIINDYTFDPVLLEQFKQYLKWYDPQNNWENIFPEWKEFLK